MGNRKSWAVFGILFGVILMGLDSTAFSKSTSQRLKAKASSLINEAVTPPPQDNEVCFSPDESCDIKLKKFIESATKSIDIAIYDINEEQIVHAILVQSKKIPVRIVVDKRQSKGNHSSVTLLLKAGVKLKYGHQRGIMHDKFTIVDGKRVETGSFNYTHHASTANQENQIYFSQPEVVERYKSRFQSIWNEAREPEIQERDRRLTGHSP